MASPINLFQFEPGFSLPQQWVIVCYITLGLFFFYVTMGSYWGFQFYKYRNEQILRNRFSHITIIEIFFILSQMIANFLVITSDLIAQLNGHLIGATILRQIAFHIGVFFDFCIVYLWCYRFWCIYFAMHWITAAYNIQWQKLIDVQHGINNWYLTKKKTWGNYKYIRKYVIILVFLSSAIVIPLRFLFDFAEDKYDFIGVSAHGLLVLIPGILLIVIFCKLPEFEDFIYVRQEMQYISVILIIIYVVGLIISEIVENVFSERVVGEKVSQIYIAEEDQIKILIIYYNFKQLANFICLYIATGWVLSMVKPLIAIGKNQAYTTHKRGAYWRPKITSGRSKSRIGKSGKRSYSSHISEDKALLLDQLDVFENITALPMEEFTRAGSNKDRDKLAAIQTNMGTSEFNICDVLSHPKAFDMFMIHLSREFSMECLLSYVEFAQYRKCVCSNMLERKLLSDNDIKQLHKLPFSLPNTVPKSSIIFERPLSKYDTLEVFIEYVKMKAFELFCKYIRIGSEYEINIDSRLRKDMMGMMGNLDNFLKFDIEENELLVIFDNCCDEMVNLMQDAFRRFTKTTQFLKLTDLIFVKDVQIIDVSNANKGK